MSAAQAAMQSAVDYVLAHPDLADFGPAVGEAAIETAVRLLHAPLPASYRAFLRRFGVGSFDGDEVYGIIEPDVAGTCIPSLVWINRDLRAGLAWPHNLVVIASSGDGGWHCLDTSHLTEPDECPVVWCDPLGRLDGPTHPSFAAYFLAITRDRRRLPQR